MESEQGVPNLAPYSFFNAFCGTPPMVGFASEGMKDSQTNAIATGEFVVNLATRAMAEAMNTTSTRVDPDVNEFDFAGVTAAPSQLVAAPRVEQSPASLECKVTQSVELRNLTDAPTDRRLLIGEVIGIYIDERYLKDGLFDAVAAGTIARMGYRDYTQVTDIFSIMPPAAVFDH